VEFAKHVKVRQEKFGAVMFETLCEKVFVTNEPGAEILRLLEEGREPIYIIAELAQNYNGDPEMIKDDVNDFMSILKAKGIIK